MVGLDVDIIGVTYKGKKGTIIDIKNMVKVSIDGDDIGVRWLSKGTVSVTSRSHLAKPSEEVSVSVHQNMALIKDQKDQKNITSITSKSCDADYASGSSHDTPPSEAALQ